MLVNIKVPDETYEAYARRNPENPRLELERTLQAFSELDPRRISLFFNQEELAEISRLLGQPVQDVKTFLEVLKKSASAGFGEGIEIQLNPAQRARLHAMANFYKRPGRDSEENFLEYAKNELIRALVIVVGP